MKDVYEQNADHAGIACAMKNSGVGVGLPDKGRCKLAVRNGVVELYSAASDIGQGCATVFLQMLAEATGLPLEKLRNMGANSEVAPDSGTTSGSRQTLITGEAVRMAAAELRADLDGAGGDLSALEGLEYSAEFFDPTDKLGADKPNPKSHVAYGFATHVVILDDDGRVKEVYAAHDSGKVVNPTSIQGQIEGGVLMGLGYALTEDFPLKDCVPQAKFGTLGLMRADQIRCSPSLTGPRASARSPPSPPRRRPRGPTTPVTTSCAPACPCRTPSTKSQPRRPPPDLPRGPGGRPSGVPLSCFSLIFQAHFYGC